MIFEGWEEMHTELFSWFRSENIPCPLMRFYT